MNNTIIHQEVERFLQNKSHDQRMELVDQDGVGYILEVSGQELVIRKTTPFNPLDHEDNVGNENTEGIYE